MTAPLSDKEFRLVNMLRSYKLIGFADEPEAQFQDPESYESMSFVDRIERCFDNHLKLVLKTRHDRLRKMAKLRYDIEIDLLQPDPVNGPDSSTLMKLRRAKFLDDGSNILISGPSGVGKTLLACAIANKAISLNKSVLFIRVPDFLQKYELSDEAWRLSMIEKMSKAALLILDDFGLNSIDPNQALFFSGIAEERYGRRSTIFTAQLTLDGVKQVVSEKANHLKQAVDNRFFYDGIWVITLGGKSHRGSAKEIKGK